jgi:hypothetical protein
MEQTTLHRCTDLYAESRELVNGMGTKPSHQRSEEDPSEEDGDTDSSMYCDFWQRVEDRVDIQDKIVDIVGEYLNTLVASNGTSKVEDS